VAVLPVNATIGSRPVVAVDELPWRRLGYAMACAAALVVAAFVARIPVQVSDSLGNLLQVQQQTYQELFLGQLYNSGYLRPLLWLQIKAAFDVSNGHYWLTFKIIHALQLLAVALMLVRLLRVRDRRGAAAAAFAVAVLFGLHTFNGTVREAFPINTFLTAIVAVVAAINLTTLRPRWWVDAAAVLLFAVTTMTVESGLLIVVALVTAWCTGLRGVSARGVGACVALTAVYFYLRFGPLDVGAPGLIERASGFGFRVREASELAARFGSNPLPFYLYNVAASLVGLMLAEPRGGVWYAVGTLWQGGSLPAWLVVNIVSGAAVSGIAIWYVGVAARRWWRGPAGEAERLALVAAAVVLANAILSYPYAKDVIMSVAGVCLALLAGLAMRELLARSTTLRRPAWRAATIVLVGVLAIGWTIRAAALPQLLAEQAFRTRSEWVAVHQWLENQQISVESEAAKALVEQLRRDAMQSSAVDPAQHRPSFANLFDLN
jgi:hypothetical protein